MIITSYLSTINSPQVSRLTVDIVNKSSNPTPEYINGSSGMDIRSSDDNIVINPSQIKIIPTGLFISTPSGYELQIRSRSGLSSKGIIVMNSPGTIDADYRGEIKVILGNFSGEPFTISYGDRIAQMVLSKVYYIDFNPVDNLDGTERGKSGFGSTGVK